MTPLHTPPQRWRWRGALLGVALLGGLGPMLAACVGGNVTKLTSTPTTNQTFSLTLQRSPGGSILATGTGYTLYAFGPDSPSRSTCLNVGCVYQWPPVLSKGLDLVGPGVNRSLVGTLKRPGGATQLSYAGHPLYTYIRDTDPGTVTGQAIDQDGGPWYVLNAAGNEIHTAFTVNN